MAMKMLLKKACSGFITWLLYFFSMHARILATEATW